MFDVMPPIAADADRDNYAVSMGVRTSMIDAMWLVVFAGADL
jgi:hypothetical protein